MKFKVIITDMLARQHQKTVTAKNLTELEKFMTQNFKIYKVL